MQNPAYCESYDSNLLLSISQSEKRLGAMESYDLQLLHCTEVQVLITVTHFKVLIQLNFLACVMVQTKNSD